MVKQAHLLSDEQLQQMYKRGHNEAENSDKCLRSSLKRNSPLHETSRPEKFAKMDLDAEIEDASEDSEFFSQEDTIDDCNVGPRFNADQEVPIQEVNITSTGHAVENVDKHLPGNVTSRVSSFGETPSLNSENNSLNWQGSTKDHFHIEKAPFYEEQNIVGSSTESFCVKFSEKNDGVVTCEKSLDKEGWPGCGESRASLTNTKYGGSDPRLTDQPRKNSDFTEKQQTVIITKEDDLSHDEVHLVPNQSPVIHHITCKYPPLPQRTPNNNNNNNNLCSSLRAIDERDLITDVSNLCLIQIG